MGSKAPATQTQTQKVEPWDAAKPFYTDLYTTARQALDATPRTPYAGQLMAGPTGAQQQAVNVFKEAALSPNQHPGVAATNQLAMDTIAGKYMNPDSNPWLAGAVEAARRPLENQLMRSILPSIEDQSIAQGAYGGSGFGTAQGLAISDFTQQALDMANRTYAENYARERAYQMAAPQMFGQAMGLQDQALQQQLAPALLLDQAGSQEQAWQQAQLDAGLQQYNMSQQAPWAGLGELAQILNGGGFSSAGITTNAPRSGAASFLQGAAGVAGMANSMFPNMWSQIGSMFGGGGTGGMSPAVAMPANLSMMLQGGW